MEIPHNLQLRDSPIHDKGIFALEKISTGTVLGEFTGTKILKTEFKKIYGNDIRYTYWTLENFKNTTVIVAKDPRNFITYINESSVPNVALKQKKLIALSDIEPGNELFLYYGKDYSRDYEL
jgi:SET domain-containing protein